MESKRLKKKDIGRPARASIAFASCSALNKAVQFLTIPIFTRLLSPSEYGTYTIFVSWESIFLMIISLNIQSNIMNNIISKWDGERSVRASVTKLVFFIGVIMTIVVIAFSSVVLEIIDLPLNIILFTILYVVLLSSFELWAATKRFEFDYKLLVCLTIIVIIINPILGIVSVKSSILQINKGLLRIYSVFISGGVVYLPIFITTIFRFRDRINFKIWKYALGMAIPLLPHYLSQIILNQADRIMISKLCGLDYAAIYGVAYSVAIVMLFVNKAINDSFTPWIYKKIKEQNFRVIYKYSQKLIIFIGLLNLLLICAAPELMLILGGEIYYDAVYIIPPVSVSSYLIFVYSLFCNYEFYFEKKYQMMIVSIVGAMLNVILNYFFINIFGYKAAGYTTLVCYIMFVVFHYAILYGIRRQYNLPELFDIKFIVLYSFFIIAISFVIQLVFEKVMLRAMIGFAVIIGLIILYKRNFTDA